MKVCKCGRGLVQRWVVIRGREILAWICAPCGHVANDCTCKRLEVPGGPF